MQQGGVEVLWSGTLQQNHGNIETYKRKIKFKNTIIYITQRYLHEIETTQLSGAIKILALGK